MKIEFDKKKSAEALSNLVQGAAGLSKKAVASAKDGVNAIVEKNKSESYLRRLKKYNPLFPEKYNSEEFNLPNVIVIVDDAVRRGIDVCEGAIGWLSTDNGVEILYLYDEAIAFSGINFIPAAACDAVYCVDNFDRSKFIRTDCVFNKAHEERLAELKHIACSLGAKRCSVEISEVSSSVQAQKTKVSFGGQLKVVTTNESAEQEYTQRGKEHLSGRVEVEFEGSDVPERPNLKWFANDDNVLRLIDMRCSGNNKIKNEILEISGASSATMSQKTAYAIDNAIKEVGASSSVSMNSQAEKEHSSKMIFYIEF